MEITDALDRFLVQLEADGRSAHTIGQYRRHVRLLANWLVQEGRSRDVIRIDHEDLACFLASPTARNRPDGKKKKATAMNALRTSLRCFFGYLHRAGVIREDPARLVRRAICAPPPPRALTEGEETKLLKVLREAQGVEARRDRVLFELMLATGIRLSSALGLDIEDADLDEGVLLLRRVKGDRTERVFINRKAQGLLRDHMDGLETGPVFQGRAGERLSVRHVQRRFRMWRQRAGVSRAVSPHSLRHTFATRLYERTGDVLIVKEALGHRAIGSTIVYAQVSQHRLRVALQ